MTSALWDRRGELWARGDDGAPARVWVVRSTAFGLVCSAWSTWGGVVRWFLPQNDATDFVVQNSPTALIALYLLYAATSKPRAVVSLVVILVGVVGNGIVSRLSTQWIMTMMSDPNYSGNAASDPVYWLIQIAGGILNLVMLWAAWGIARRRSTAWLWSLPVPLLFTVLTPLWLQGSLESLATMSHGIELMSLLVVILPVVISILAGWAADVAFGSAPPSGPTAAPKETSRDPLFG